MTTVYFEGGYQETKIYMLSELQFGQKIEGPAIIMDKLSTILIEPGEKRDYFPFEIYMKKLNS